MSLRTKNKKIGKFTLIIIIVLVVSAVLPIKISIKSEDDIDSEEYYIVYLVPEGTTDAGQLECHDQNDIYYHNISFEGKLPDNILSEDVYKHGTTFIIYGDLTQNDDSYILHSQDWDILYQVNRDPESLRIDFRRFITIYDMKWFDFLLSGNYHG